MKKTEMVHLHMLLAQFKKYCEAKGVDCDFTKYKELSTSPFQVHLSMDEHKHAIFVLALALLAATKQIPEAATMKEACICTFSNFYVPTTP
jgi:hypothetical protein